MIRVLESAIIYRYHDFCGNNRVNGVFFIFILIKCDLPRQGFPMAVTITSYNLYHVSISVLILSIIFTYIHCRKYSFIMLTSAWLSLIITIRTHTRVTSLYFNSYSSHSLGSKTSFVTISLDTEAATGYSLVQKLVSSNQFLLNMVQWNMRDSESPYMRFFLVSECWFKQVCVIIFHRAFGVFINYISTPTEEKVVYLHIQHAQKFLCYIKLQFAMCLASSNAPDFEP